ncbi:MAG TPA: TIGR01777 family oxidoreductase [Sphingobacteriaceae bacterium]
MQGKILITGGSGMVGSALTRRLLENGFSVSHLSRNPGRSGDSRLQTFQWDVGKGYADPDSFGDVTAIIHLAGENIGSNRWTPERRRAILTSRTESIRLLYRLLRKMPGHQVRTVVSASAAGYYGDRGDEVLTETSGPGSGFLSDTVTSWEQAVLEGEDLGLRIAMLRCGIVLDRSGGALPAIEKPLRAGFASELGSGRQWVPWIHLRDLVRLYQYLLDSPELQGPFNACAPEQITNAGLTAALRKRTGRSILMPNIPAFLLRMILGEQSDMVLGSTRMSSYAIEAAGFTFEFPTLKESLNDLYSA